LNAALYPFRQSAHESLEIKVNALRCWEVRPESGWRKVSKSADGRSKIHVDQMPPMLSLAKTPFEEVAPD
jgi:hypothetical protein